MANHPSGLTVPQHHALAAVHDLNLDPTRRRKPSPRDVAKYLWPDSKGWTKVSSRHSTPAGGALGATMPMKAATVLWRLHEHGLVDYDQEWGHWTVTDKGRRVLAGEETVTPVVRRREPEPVRNPKTKIKAV